MITFKNTADADVTALAREIQDAVRALTDGTGAGSTFRGWVDLPITYPAHEEYARIKEVAVEIRAQADALVVIGIGGSYLGARAVIDALTHTYQQDGVKVYFAGKNISATELSELRDVLAAHESVYVNVISKSGTTLEPAMAFRVLREDLEARYGAEGAQERIIATTDGAQGALHDLAEKKGYQTFVVPDDVGGRYSVLTPVGLLPIAVAGIDIDALMAGAATQAEACRAPFADNACLQYAAARTALYRSGTKVEVLASYEPKLAYVLEWWKQLFGESEGKEHKGLFPASMQFTTDLHSLGQYMQEGSRIMCETVVSVTREDDTLRVPVSDESADGLDAYVGMPLGAINRIAQDATSSAHAEGGVSVMNITMPTLDARSIGAVLYFFEYACAVSGYMLGVNPFDQPGVEVYKKKMYSLLSESQKL